MKKALTDLRKEILELIQSSENPLCARDILERLSAKPDFSSVYRALEFLEKSGWVRTVSFSENTRFYYACSKGHCHFVYCEKCHRAKEFHRCFENQLSGQVENETGYQITGHSFYFTGICKNCREQSSFKKP